MFKKKKYSSDEYRYSSAKVACMSSSLPTEANVLALTELSSIKALVDRLPELGLGLESEPVDDTLEARLSAILSEKYSYLSKFLPDSELCLILQARFDTHNLKTAIKCSKAGLDPTPYYIPSGSFDTTVISKAVETQKFDAFPKTIAIAASKAYEAINSNASARAVDTLLDNACFEYMGELASSLGCQPVSSLLSVKADITNVTTMLRILKISNPETQKAVMSDSFVTGGKIKVEELTKETDMLAVIAHLDGVITTQRADKAKKLVEAKASVDAVSSFLDSAFYSTVTDMVKKELLGIYPVLEYIARVEYLVKNMRIIAAGIAAGKNPDKIREEVRAYV